MAGNGAVSGEFLQFPTTAWAAFASVRRCHRRPRHFRLFSVRFGLGFWFDCIYRSARTLILKFRVGLYFISVELRRGSGKH
ncbi:hypothetical protein RchiOBHm_Chr2g0090551 [Rosa chinensis]|uniref:Uncharacterized protein n=1 Tax=Rosa chinensis TaxID=74649 RepID=A0A2P6RJG4_ROSCH|nr:hypothetical protein RchiOBHm_Chr2g0090551 [Rosa chinensis]